MVIKFLHDDDCPLGTNGLRAYQEAREAFASTPPEACRTEEDLIALAFGEWELEQKQVCTCGLSTFEQIRL